MRRVKKTTNEQFDLLKAEMAVHPTAARGYGVGANKALVDAEWKDIVNKLNAIGPPQRTMSEWKKVWSDLRLRNIKRLSEEFTPRPKKVKYKSESNKVIEDLNNSNSIYAPYGEASEQNISLVSANNENESLPDLNESYENNPLREEELNNTENQSYNPPNSAALYGVNFLEEDGLYCNNSNNNNSDYHSHRDAVQSHYNKVKFCYLEQTLCTIEQQIKNQNKAMEHLLKITSNLTELMERHVANLEKQNRLMERQLKACERQNIFLKRQEARRKIRSKSKSFRLHKS